MDKFPGAFQTNEGLLSRVYEPDEPILAYLYSGLRIMVACILHETRLNSMPAKKTWNQSEIMNKGLSLQHRRGLWAGIGFMTSYSGDLETLGTEPLILGGGYTQNSSNMLETRRWVRLTPDSTFRIRGDQIRSALQSLDPRPLSWKRGLEYAETRRELGEHNEYH